MPRLIDAFEQFFDDNAQPLTSGMVDFFESGSSTVRKATFADAAETIPNPNPLIINGDGRCPNAYGTGNYRAVLRDKDFSQILERDPIGGNESIEFGADWLPEQIYSVTDVVRDGGKYWQSVTSGNLGNKPELDSGANWTVALISSDTNVTVKTIEALKDLPTDTYLEGQVITVTDPGVGDPFNVRFGAAVDDGGVVNVFNDNPLRSAIRAASGLNVRPEWWGVVYNDIGAAADNKIAYDQCLAYTAVNGGKILHAPKKMFYAGVMSPFINGAAHARIIEGVGSNSSEIEFVLVSGQTEGILFFDNSVNVQMRGLTIRGPGKSVLNDALQPVTGLTDRTATDSTNGSDMRDIVFREWSGDGCNIVKFFQQRWAASFGRDCGGWGMVLSGDQAIEFTSAGARGFSRNNGTGGLWIKTGALLIQRYNGQNENIGIKVGEDASRRAVLIMDSCNLENMNEDSTGIHVSEFSRVERCLETTIQGREDAMDNTKTMRYPVFFERMNGYNDVSGIRPVWFQSSDSGGMEHGIYIALAEPLASIKGVISRFEPINVRPKNTVTGSSDISFAGSVITSTGPDLSVFPVGQIITINGSASNDQRCVVGASTTTTITCHELDRRRPIEFVTEGAASPTIDDGAIPYVSGANAGLPALYDNVVGSLFDDNPVDAMRGIYNHGIAQIFSRTHTASTDGTVLELNPNIATGITDAQIYYLDSDTSNITARLPGVSEYNDILVTFKLISPGNAATILPSGGTIDGAANYPLITQYQSVTIHSPIGHSQWFVTATV